MMVKLIYSIPIVILFSCSESEQVENDFMNQIPKVSVVDSNDEMFFDGNYIILENVKSENSFGEQKEFNVMKIEKAVGDITLRAQRIPTELYLKNQGLSDSELTAALAELHEEQLFYFEFEEFENQDLMKKYFADNMDQKVSYMSFDIFQDFSLVNSKGDTITANYSLYERNFHVAPFERLIVSFSSVTEDENLKLIYNDELFGKGISEFSFPSTNYLQNNTKQPS